MSLDITLAGRVALVTGGAGGIGVGIASRLRDAGASVLLADLEAEAAHEAADRLGDQIDAVALDVLDEDAAAALAERHPDVSVLVNNAGVASRVGMPFTRLRSADWTRPWDVNVRGTFVVTAAFTEALRRNLGAVVNIASVSGRRGFTTSPPYSASKAAVINLTQVMAADLAPDGVRVNAVCPGMVLTPFYREQRLAAAEHDPALHDITDDEYFAAKATRLVPLGRGQQPADIGAAVAFLASDLASEITGQALNVDGGLVMS